jgi:hypothetical protein
MALGQGSHWKSTCIWCFLFFQERMWCDDLNICNLNRLVYVPCERNINVWKAKLLRSLETIRKSLPLSVNFNVEGEKNAVKSLHDRPYRCASAVTSIL